MNRIRLEARKRQKRKRLLSWVSVIAASLLLLGMGGYILLYHSGYKLIDYLPEIKGIEIPTDMISFYTYIAVLVLALLGLDHRIRQYRRKTADE